MQNITCNDLADRHAPATHGLFQFDELSVPHVRWKKDSSVFSWKQLMYQKYQSKSATQLIQFFLDMFNKYGITDKIFLTIILMYQIYQTNRNAKK